MENKASVSQKYRRGIDDTRGVHVKPLYRSCFFLCNYEGVPRCTDSGDDFDFVYSSASSWRQDLYSSIFMSLF